MIRRFYFVTWFVAALAVFPFGVASFYVPVRDVFFVALFWLGLPWLVAMIEYIVSGKTEWTSGLISGGSRGK